MLHKKIIILLMIASGVMLLLAGCYKNKTVIITPEVTKTVSFSQDLIPIFNKNCSLSGCHTTGGQSPNLSASSAYNSLTNGNYIDKSNPENSILYRKMSGSLGNPMPPSGVNQDYAALVLAWIKQGANNN